VTVNGSSAYRKNEYFHREVSVSNGSAPVWQSVSTIASLGGSTTTNTGNMYVAKTPEVLTYDLDGNQLTDGRWSNTWDAENRLILQETIGTVPTGAKKRLIHEYDWMGRRIRKQVYNWVASAWSLVQDERFLYDGWNVIAILDSATTIQQTQLWGKDLSGSLQGAGGVGGLLAISHLPSSRTYFTGYDGNGNVTVLVDGVSGLTEGNFEYAPFGELIRASGTAVAVCPWRFSTKYEDAETGMLYYGYRFYNPSTGRWLSRDPINEYGGLNLFAFVQNNGLFWIDYLGLDDQSNGGQPIPHDAPKPLSKCTVTVVVGHNDKALDYALGIGGQKCAAVGAIACVSGKGPVNDLLAEGGLPVIEDYPVLPLFINPNIGKAKKGIFHNINKLYEDNLDSDDCVSTSTSICKPPQISYRDWEAMNGPQRYSSMLYATWMAADNHARRLCNENCCPQITIIFKFLPQKVLTKDSFFKDAVLHAGNSPTPLQPPNYEGKDELRWTVQCKQ
jgi:RHS repeat-associated protein